VLNMNQTAEDTMVLRCHLLLNNPARIELRSPLTSELLLGSSNSGHAFGYILTRAISCNKTPFYRGFCYRVWLTETSQAAIVFIKTPSFEGFCYRE
jgi:hypothetical protein